MIHKTGVYKITNNITGRFYIGSASKSFKNRWAYKYNKYLEKAFKKRGKENFTFEILLVCEPSECLYYEQIFIDKYCIFGENKNCYNINPTAGSCKGMKHTEESKKKMSKAKLGKKNTDEHKKNVSKALIGRKCEPFTDEHRKNLSVASTGRKHTDKSKEKMSKGHLGKKYKPMTDTGRANISLAHRKLSSDEILEIRFYLSQGVSQTSIAETYEVSQKTISNVKNNRNYKDNT